MNALSENLQTFVDEMRLSREAAEYGFTALTKKRMFNAALFQRIYDAGLLAPDRIPNSVPAKAIGYVQIPYWSALDYLEGVAEHARSTLDLPLANLLVEIMVDISINNNRANKNENYHTNRRFIEITAKLPLEAINDDLIKEMGGWIFTKYDRALSVAAISDSLLPELLQTKNADQRKHAITILRYVTEIRGEDDGALESKEPEFKVDPYWLKELLNKHTLAYIEAFDFDFINVIRQRLREVYSFGSRHEASWLSRPAIEDHAQNHDWDDVNNLFVDILRDALATLIRKMNGGAILSEIASIYKNGEQIERRIAIHLFNEQFEQLKDIVNAVIDAKAIDQGCLHETYWFLKNNFSLLASAAQEKLISSIELLTSNNLEVDSAEVWLQRRFLHALVGHEHPKVELLRAKLASFTGVNEPAVIEHPDFLTYMTSWIGPGPSPFTQEELIWSLEEGRLVEMLNSFEPKDRWTGPSRRALVDTLESAIKQVPAKFIEHAGLILELQRPYQYAFFNSFKELWSATPTDVTPIEWQKAWKTLFELANIILDEKFWNESTVDDGSLTPTRDWIPGVLCSLIREGSRTDDHAFGKSFIPNAINILRVILDNTPVLSELADRDPMSYALNSIRGKAIDALFTVSLRAMRLADRHEQDKTQVWMFLVPIFDGEIARIDLGNYEFITLAASYCAQLIYLNENWFDEHKTKILSPQSDLAFKCAISGLAYAPANKRLHTILKEAKTYDRVLSNPSLPEESRGRVIERLILSFLWDQELIDSPLIEPIICSELSSDLKTALKFLRKIHTQDLTKRQRALALEFWHTAAVRLLNGSENFRAKYPELLGLICYVDSLDEAMTKLIIQLISVTDFEHLNIDLTENLTRLVHKFPKEIAQIAIFYLQKNGSEYDVEGHWLCIATTLAEKGFRIEAIQIAEIMRDQAGFNELYRHIRVG